jgi:histone acetyltransferase (RNA polymerase elongator complex component)
MSEHYARLERDLQQALDSQKPPLEIAFFGGTFTSLPGDWALRFVDLAESFRQAGLVTRIRCSTRPDSLVPGQLQDLRRAGLDMIELGVQSFSSQALRICRRGYDAEVALKACRTVRELGLELGVQLMPGLPGQSHWCWHQDVRILEDIQPASVRLYPCLVFAGTELEEMWLRGHYRPWSLRTAVGTLARTVLSLWRHGIQVIRTGVANEDGLQEQVRAGPWHPSLGTMVRSRILASMLITRALCLGSGPKTLVCPRRYSGELWGFQGENRPRLKRHGITSEGVTFWDRPEFVLGLN